MTPLWRRLPRATLPIPSRRLITDARPFRENDHVLLRPTRDAGASPLLRGPLKPGKRIETHKGVILHDDILGKRVRDSVSTAPSKTGKSGTEFRIYEVKLEEYVRMSRRMVTPIYPADANLIVSLLDLHPEVYDPAKEDEDDKLEILEAGTGHGALTLYLSRAIHAANPPKPTILEQRDPEATDLETNVMLDMWKGRRRAVLHTTDIAHQYSRHAQNAVRGFRHGLYADNVDFHVGDVREWLAKTTPERDNEPFLSAAFLDLPSADAHLEAVARVLRVNGTLVVFNPSITQIMDCAMRAKKEGIPLELETVIELGVNGGSGGREWDVRPVKPRAERTKEAAQTGDAAQAPGTEKATATEPENAAASENVASISDGELPNERELEQAPEASASKDSSMASPVPEENSKWSMVCRPKVGDRVVGGGFLGVWKKQRV